MTELLLLIAILAIALATLIVALAARGRDLGPRFDELARTLERLERENRNELARLRSDLLADAQGGRKELAERAAEQADQARESLREGAAEQAARLETFARRLGELSLSLEQRLEALRSAIDKKLGEIRVGNEAKLDQMRAVVDEKLQATLTARIGESFKQVSDRLDAVHQGLGDMQNLAVGVGDLKRVLGNVKNRGTWGEYQLGSILEEILAPGQYATNVATVPGSSERVEYAVRFPGREGGDQLWLPIDSKFPLEDYQRLVEAQERADAPALAEAAKALEDRVLAQAKDIRTKYVEPPATTDFGILFVPVESLYAEILRRPGLFERLKRDQKVILAGPTTLTALIGSFAMGFRTLAIEKRSSEIRDMLSAVRTEFDKFGGQLDKVKRKIDEAASSVDEMGKRSRAMNRRLRGVDALPESQAAEILELGAGSDDES